MNSTKMKHSLDWPSLSYHERRYTIHYGVLPKRFREQREQWQKILTYRFMDDGTLIRNISENLASSILVRFKTSYGQLSQIWNQTLTEPKQKPTSSL